MELGISETQFVFTYLHHYLNLPRRGTLRFVLPTLSDEANPSNPYAGADLVIGAHLYIQFKMADYLAYYTPSEIRKKKLVPSYMPYFRFNIKNAPTTLGPGQYDLLVNRAAASTSNIVKYVSPVFDQSIYSYDTLKTNFWYVSFLSSRPTTALYSFIAEVPIHEIIRSRVVISANDSHRICYNYSDISAHNPVYIFSEEARIKIELGPIEYNRNNEDFNIDNNRTNSIEQEMKELSFLINDPKVSQMNLEQMQQLLLRVFNIFWIPIGFINKEE